MNLAYSYLEEVMSSFRCRSVNSEWYINIEYI